MGSQVENRAKYPIVVSTWPFVDAVRAAWKAVDGGLSAIDAVVEGCSACEELRCDGTGNPPNKKMSWIGPIARYGTCLTSVIWATDEGFIDQMDSLT